MWPFAANRHPHAVPEAFTLQSDGSVTLIYNYAGRASARNQNREAHSNQVGNITSRQLPAFSYYTVGGQPLELFSGRDYTNGLNAAPDNQIHGAGFAHARGPACGVGAARGVRPRIARQFDREQGGFPLKQSRAKPDDAR